MINYKFIGLVWFVMAVGSMSASAELGVEAATEQVRANLIASAAAVRPGDEILIGVHQRIIPHWHTYWKNPGDSGLPTIIQYQLPPGTAVGDILWPTPKRIMLGPVVNYGYQDAVTLLSTLKVADDAPVGGEIPVKAEVKWLVCEETCIPQKVELLLRLPVLAPGVAVQPGSALIEPALSALPIVLPWQVRLHEDSRGLVLRFSGSGLASLSGKQITFYPDQWGRISHAAEQIAVFSDDALELRVKLGDLPVAPGENLTGVLTVGDGNAVHGYQVNVTLPISGTPPGPVQAAEDMALPSAMMLALAGGLILNLMPCVFPVLSIKVLALLLHVGHAGWRGKLHGWAYAAGIQASFAGLAVVLIALKAGGAGVGWGFQFQSPWFVLSMVYLVFAVGLNLSGVFSLGDSIAGLGSGLAARSGYSGSFFGGVLAAVVATPCTAPFMGAAIGFALSQPALTMLAVFLSLGVGLALPYLLLCHWPALQHCLPKPGRWMETLKHGLAFPMYAAAAWLVWVLARQAGAAAVAGALVGCVTIGFSAWLYDVSRNASEARRKAGGVGAALLLALAVAEGYAAINGPEIPTHPANAAEETWQVYSAERLSRFRAEGKPVFVNFTADWCISCLANERLALSQPSVLAAFRESGVVYLKGDWTNRDPDIARVLAEYGRSGVPLYLYFAPDARVPEVLPQILTPGILIGSVGGGH